MPEETPQTQAEAVVQQEESAETLSPDPQPVTPIQQEGLPATGHLSSEGNFATINPAGVLYGGPDNQVEVAAHVPPSVERLREKGHGFTNQEEAGAGPTETQPKQDLPTTGTADAPQEHTPS